MHKDSDRLHTRRTRRAFVPRPTKDGDWLARLRDPLVSHCDLLREGVLFYLLSFSLSLSLSKVVAALLPLCHAN